MSNKEPIFKSIFGADWDQLPPVMKKHYANRPYSDEKGEVVGKLDTYCAGPIKWMAPLFWMLKGIPPHSEENISVKVYFESDPNSAYFYFNRIFYFKTRKPYQFISRMVQIKGSEVVEVMRYGLGWRMEYLWEEGKVKLKHKGYVLYLFGHFVRLPISLLIGIGYAEETPVDETTFDMAMHITHPIWGKVYEYKGRFSMVSTDID